MAHQLTMEEREIISQMRSAKRKPVAIARRLGRHRSTIGRELNRNSQRGSYSAVRAQRLAEKRRRERPLTRKMSRPKLQAEVCRGLENYWSPDQIAGQVRRDFPRASWRWLSRQTIYDWIHYQQPEWQTRLRRGGRPPEKRGKLPGCVRIDGRPDVINGRFRYGDWEGDTIVGLGRRSALVTMVERKSGYLRMGRVDSMKSDDTMRVAKRKLKYLPTHLRRSMTFDNGKEFAEHERLTRSTGMDVYFTDPYASWQKGTNENTNGLVRQFFPKGTDFTQVSHHEVACVERLINERPRRRHGYRTPQEILDKYLCCN